MKFYLSFTNFIPFNGTKYFILKSVFSGNSRWINVKYDEKDADYIQNINRIEGEIFENIYPNVQEADHTIHVDIDANAFKNVIHFLYRLNLIKAIITAGYTRPEYQHIVAFIFDNERLNMEGLNEINRLAENHKQIIDRAEVPTGQFQPYTLRRDFPYPYDWRFTLIESIWILNTEESRILLKELIYTEERLFIKLDRPIGRISNYSFAPYFSAGEYSFLTFYSRISDAIDRYNKGLEGRDNLILFIDEAEVGFHPAWKKNFLKYLLDFLNKHTSNYTFQLILTTHSPYLLSDLSSSNVLLIKKGGNGFTEIVPSDHFATFGANIHELLANTFFWMTGQSANLQK